MVRINLGRLRSTLAAVNAVGLNRSTNGFNRIGFSEADMAGRRLFLEMMSESGLSCRMDGVGNVFGRYGRMDRPCIMLGSHLDTVPEGGAFDGVLGACVALECVRALQDNGIVPSSVAVEVVGTSEEEGRFGGMLGSQSIARAVTETWLRQARDANNVYLVDAMSDAGLDAMSALECGWRGSAIHPLDIRGDVDIADDGDEAGKVGVGERDARVLAFLELHIEQGPVLDTEGLSVGVVGSISGVSSCTFEFTGKANHSGTTPMHLRSDAYAGLAAFTSQIPHITNHFTSSTEARITVGKVDLLPNFPHTIPGFASATVITRDTDAELMHGMLDTLKRMAVTAAKQNNLSVTWRENSWLDPVTLDTRLADVVEEEVKALGYPYKRMSSGAGHDAQTTQQHLCPSALVFVPSIGGVSHAPSEDTHWDHIEQGAQVYLNTLLRLIS